MRAGLSNLKTEARGRGERGSEGSAPTVLAERGRIGGGRLEEEEGPDGWAPPVSRQRERGKGERPADWLGQA